MPLKLKEDRWDERRLELYVRPWAEAGSVVHRAAMSLLRECSTMVSGEGTAYRLRDYLRWCHRQGLDVLDATRDDVQAWLSEKKHLSPATRKPMLGAVRKLYEELIDRDAVVKNPTRRLSIGRHTKQRIRSLTLEEAERVIEGIRAELDGNSRDRLVAARDYFIFAIALTCGPRATEMRRLSLEDFQLEGDPPVALMFGKFQKHETKVLSPIAVEAFRNWCETLQEALARPLDREDALVIALNKVKDLAKTPVPLRPMSGAALYALVSGRLRDAGLEGKKLGTHRLRKSAATLAYRNHADLDTIRAMLGHTQLSVTLRDYVIPEETLAESASLKIPLKPMGLQFRAEAES